MNPIHLTSVFRFNSNTFYPNCDKSRMLLQMTGTKAIPQYVIEIMRKLGFDVVISGSVNKTFWALNAEEERIANDELQIPD